MLSVITISKLQLAELPFTSVTKSVMFVMPRLTLVPVFGDCVIEAIPQLSELVARPV